MIPRTIPKKQFIGESVAEASFIASKGIDETKAPTQRDAVSNLKNLEINYDGSISPRNPLLLKNNINYTIVSVLYNGDYLCILPYGNKYSLSVFSKKTGLEYPSESNINIVINNEDVNVINTTSSTIIQNCEEDNSELATYKLTCIKQENSETLSWTSEKMIISINNLEFDEHGNPQINPNLMLSNPLSFRDKYNHNALNAIGILAYFNDVDSEIPVYVKDLTENEKFKIIESFPKTTNNLSIYLKAFIHNPPLTDSQKISFWIRWEKTLDGVYWIGANEDFKDNLTSEEILNFDTNNILINVPNKIINTIDITDTNNTPKLFKRYSPNSENDIIRSNTPQSPSRYDILVIQNDDSLKYSYRCLVYMLLEDSESSEIELNLENTKINTIDNISEPTNLNNETFYRVATGPSLDNRRFNIQLELIGDTTNLNNTVSEEGFSCKVKTVYTPKDSETAVELEEFSEISENFSFTKTDNVYNFTGKLPFYDTYLNTDCINLKYKTNITIYYKNTKLKEFEYSELINRFLVSSLNTFSENISFTEPTKCTSYMYTNLTVLINLTNFKDIKSYYISKNTWFKCPMQPIVNVSIHLAPEIAFSSAFTYTFVKNSNELKITNNNTSETITMSGGVITSSNQQKLKTWLSSNVNITAEFPNILSTLPNLTVSGNFKEILFNSLLKNQLWLSLSKISSVGVDISTTPELLNGLLYDLNPTWEASSSSFTATVTLSFIDNIYLYYKNDTADGTTLIKYNEQTGASQIYNGSIPENEISLEYPTADFYYDPNNAAITVVKDGYQVGYLEKAPIPRNTSDSKIELLTLDLGVNNANKGYKLYWNHRIVSYGPFNNNVLFSNSDSLITPLLNTLTLNASQDTRITTIVPWRNYLISATKEAIYLIYEIEGGLGHKVVNTFIGIPEQDRRTCKAILNGVIFKSNNKIYTLQPGIYNNDDSVLNIAEISQPIESLLSNIENSGEFNFAISTSKYYYLFVPGHPTSKTTCFKYEYVRKTWTTLEFPIKIKDYIQTTEDELYLISDTNAIYSFEENFTKFVKDNRDSDNDGIPDTDIIYGDYLEGYNSPPTPIEFSIDSGQKTDNISTTKQFVETKIITATMDNMDSFPLDVDIYIDGIKFKNIHTDINTDGAVLKRTTQDGLILGTNTTPDDIDLLNTFRQLILRYSGKGKSIRHIISGSTLYNFKIYVTYYRYKLTHNKQ